MQAAERDWQTGVMELAQGLSLIGLLIGTLDYAVVIRHRAERRRVLEHTAAEARAIGLHGLVRVFLTEN